MRVSRVVAVVLAALAFGPAAASAAPQLANPSFDTSTAGWSVFGFADLFRDEAVYNSAPAAAQWGTLGANDTVSAPFIGTFNAHATYTLHFSYLGDGDGYVRVAFGPARMDLFVMGGEWHRALLVWKPRFSMRASVAFKFLTATSRSVPLATLYVDDVNVTDGATPGALSEPKRLR